MSVLRGRALAMYVGLCLVWGSTWLAIKIGLRDLPPLRFAGIRMAAACLLLTPLAFRCGAPAVRGRARWIAGTGLLQIGVCYACIFMGEQWIGSGLAAVLFATFPIFAGLFAHLFLPGERLTAQTALSASLGLMGVAIVEGPATFASFSGPGRDLAAGGALLLGAAASGAFANVLNKKHLSGVAPLTNVWGQTLAGATLLLALSAAFESGVTARWTPSAVGALVYLTVMGTAIPFVGLFWLIPRVPVAVVGMIPVVDTVIAVLLGNLILGETLSPRVLAGGAFILLGVLLAASIRAPASATGVDGYRP